MPAGTSFGTVKEGPARLRGAVLTVAGHDHHCGAALLAAIATGHYPDATALPRPG